MTKELSRKILEGGGSISPEQAVMVIRDYRDLLGLPVTNFEYKAFVKGVIDRVEDQFVPQDSAVH